MRSDDRDAGLSGLPPELAELDRELSSLNIQERPSFGVELAGELSREWVRERSAPSFGRGRRAALAAVVSLFFVGLAFSPLRASLVKLVGSFLPAEETVAAPAAPAPKRPAVDLALPKEDARPVPAARAPLWSGEELQPLASVSPPFDPGRWSYPELVDVEADRRLMRRYYPPNLLERGIGGRVLLRLWVDSAGVVDGVQLRRTSGYSELDHAALRAAVALRFTPARRRGVPVGTWVEFPLVFVPETAHPDQVPAAALEIPDPPESEMSELPPAWSGDAVVTAPMEVESESMLRAAMGRSRSELEAAFGPLRGVLSGEPPAGVSPMRWRREVAAALEEARVRDPDNPAPYLALARIRLKQGLRGDARDLLEDGIARASRGGRPVSSRLMAELYYERGLILKDAWQGWNHVGRVAATAFEHAGCAHAGEARTGQGGGGDVDSPGEEASAASLIALSFLCPDVFDRVMGEQFQPSLRGTSEREDMLNSFQRAVATFPAHVGANTELLAALAERGRWYDVLKGARRFAWASEGDVQALLFSGIALQRLGRSQEALQDFSTALDGLPPEDARRLTDPSALMDRAAARDLAGLSEESRARRLREFWDPLDPILITAVNEREVEHLARAAYALLLFGGPDTDPGRVIVRYGLPMAIRALSEGQGLRTEFWDYGMGPDLSFQGVAGKMDLTPESGAYLEELRQSFPHLWTDTRPVFPLPAQVAHFRADGGGDVEIHARIPAAMITGSRDSLDLAVFVVEGSQRPRELERERLSAEGTYLRLNVLVPFGTDRIVVELYHPRLGQAATLAAPAFRGEDEDPRISDILLVPMSDPDRKGLSRDAVGVDPSPGLEGVTPDSVGLFFEIYDLGKKDDRYQVRAELQPEGSELHLPLPIRPAGQRRFDSQWSLKPATRGAPFPEYLTVDLSGVGPGNHTLHLFVVRRDGETLHEAHELRVVDGPTTRAPPDGLEAPR